VIVGCHITTGRLTEIRTRHAVLAITRDRAALINRTGSLQFSAQRPDLLNFANEPIADETGELIRR